MAKWITFGIGWIAATAISMGGPVPNAGLIMTVSGAIPPEELGKCLSHEHVLVDFGGAAVAEKQRYDRDEVVEFVLPYLMDLKARGYSSLVEATPAYLGRDPELLQQLSKESGLHLLTNTGYYPLREGLHIPKHAFSETAQELADRWIAESRDGIGERGVRPGFIKIAVSNAPVPQVDRKIIRAAAKTHLSTGLTIAMHTGSGQDASSRAQAGLTALEILKEEGVSPQALVWVHAQGSAGEWGALIQAVQAGAWISFDGFSRENRIDRILPWVQQMKSAGYLDQLLISHDNGWYRAGEENTPDSFKPYTVIPDKLVPRLIQENWSPEDIDRLLITNPQRALTVSVRR